MKEFLGECVKLHHLFTVSSFLAETTGPVQSSCQAPFVIQNEFLFSLNRAKRFCFTLNKQKAGTQISLWPYWGQKHPFPSPRGTGSCIAGLKKPFPQRAKVPPLSSTIHLSPTLGLDHRVPPIPFTSRYWELGVGRGCLIGFPFGMSGKCTKGGKEKI